MTSKSPGPVVYCLLHTRGRGVATTVGAKAGPFGPKSNQSLLRTGEIHDPQQSKNTRNEKSEKHDARKKWTNWAVKHEKFDSLLKNERIKDSKEWKILNTGILKQIESNKKA